MKLKIITLLVIIIVGIWFLAINSGYSDAVAVSPQIRPNLPSGVFVTRIYYDSLEELNALAAYDVWEYNNLHEHYVLVSLDGPDYLKLEQEGWHLQVDEEQTAHIASNTSPFSSGYRTVEEIYSYLERRNSQFPQLTELVNYGQSGCLVKGGCATLGGESLPGHELLALRITNEDVRGGSTVADSTVSEGSKPVLFLLANIHARELATPEIALHLIDYLLDNYGRDADVTWLVDWHEIWIVPTANPDGHWLVELGANPAYNQGAFYQRKNANLDADGDGTPDCSVWPPESSWQYGVDLNRNHSFSWGNDGSTAEPCSQTFRGPAPASEPEISSLQSLIRLLIPDQRGESDNDAAPQATTGLLLTLHSFGELVLWPWGTTAAQSPNFQGLRAIGDKLAAYSDYQSCQASTCLYFASGTTDDWAYGELGIPAFTVEIGRRFMPDYADIEDTLWPENLPALIYAARIARTPYQTILGPDVYDVNSTASEEEGTVTITATIDDRDHGGSNVTAASYSIDLPYWAEGAEIKSMAALDGILDDQLEYVTATISLAELAPGNHIIYVNGRNNGGHWGVTSSTFVIIEPNTEPNPITNIFFPYYVYSYSP